MAKTSYLARLSYGVLAGALLATGCSGSGGNSGAASTAPVVATSGSISPASPVEPDEATTPPAWEGLDDTTPQRLEGEAGNAYDDNHSLVGSRWIYRGILFTVPLVSVIDGDYENEGGRWLLADGATLRVSTVRLQQGDGPSSSRDPNDIQAAGNYTDLFLATNPDDYGSVLLNVCITTERSMKEMEGGGTFVFTIEGDNVPGGAAYRAKAGLDLEVVPN